MDRVKLERILNAYLSDKNYSLISIGNKYTRQMHLALIGSDRKIGLYNLILGYSDETSKFLWSGVGMSYEMYNSIDDQEYWIGSDELASIMLSDNEKLYIRLFNTHRIKLSNDRSGGFHWQRALLQIATSQWAGLEETVEDLKKLKEHNAIFHDIDIYYSIYSGFLNKDKSLLENALFELELPKYRNERQGQVTIEKYISLYTTALAKLAWMHGMEVDIDSKFVPKEILPFEPLEEYTIPYRFLRDFYREQGVDWRYDPVYPELQDWENDPENPKNQKGGFLKKLFS